MISGRLHPSARFYQWAIYWSARVGLDVQAFVALDVVEAERLIRQATREAARLRVS